MNMNGGRHSRPFRARPMLATALALVLSGGTSAIAGDAGVLLHAAGAGEGVVASTTGGGIYSFAGVLDIRFAFNARERADGSANGRFHHSVVLDGQLIEFHGEVICLTVDSDNGRAWIGGVITQNNSEHPAFQAAIHDPGRDIWFRVLDNGEGRGEADRTTFVGFEGGAGIDTSEEYCLLALWLDDNANTHPVVSGNLQVRP